MKTIQIGQTKLMASRLAYGCWRLAGPWEDCEITPQRVKQGRQAVIAAYENGYTLFDHADIHCSGEAENIFGKLLQEIPEMRSRVLITSKCGIRKAGDPNSDSPYRYDSSSEYIVQSCENSLKRLGIETIDLYFVHRPDYLGHPDEVARAFTQLHQQGKVKEFGLSNFSPAQFALYQEFCPMPLVVHQVEINLYHLARFHDGTLDRCLSQRITPMAWAPLAGGRLASSDPIDLRDPDHAHRIKIRETLDLIARLYQVSRSVVALAWLLKHPSQMIPIIGSSDPEEIKDLTQAAHLDLSREEWYQVMQAAYGERLP